MDGMGIYHSYVYSVHTVCHATSANRSYTRSVLHNLFNTQQFLHELIAPQAWSYTKLLCITLTIDTTRGDSLHASIQHAVILHSPQFNTNRFHTSPIQHNPFLHITFSPQSWSCTTVPRFCTRTYIR